MNCDSCNRDNVIKSYCYFSHNPDKFITVTKKKFSITAFADFAVEMDLSCKYCTSCLNMTRGAAMEYWTIIKPYLITAYNKQK